LPPLEYDVDTFIDYDSEEEAEVWTDEAVRFGKRLRYHFVQIDKQRRAGSTLTPQPEWVQHQDYKTNTEIDIEASIQEKRGQIQAIEKELSQLTKGLEKECGARRLLFESGKPLEEAIEDALALLGFVASRFRDDTSEFDVVFESSEGRFLGEAEGKDNRAINIDKIRQLESNLQEDFAREEVSAYAKGVLFGNAFRLVPPNERGAFFTEKCLAAAKRAGLALVRTPDLFDVAKYVKNANNETYKQKCRQAIKNTNGDIVEFPPPLEN